MQAPSEDLFEGLFEGEAELGSIERGAALR